MQQGFILPTVMIFLLIFTLLGLSALSLSQLEMHMSRNTQTAQMELESAETGLRTAEITLIRNQSISCLISMQFNPWKSDQTCQFSSNCQTGQYVIEPFPKYEYFCVKQGESQHTALFYRITAWFAFKQTKHPTIVQSIFVKPGELYKGKCHEIMVGRTSWQEIS